MWLVFQVYVRYGVWASDVVKPQLFERTEQGILLQASDYHGAKYGEGEAEHAPFCGAQVI